MSNTSAKMAAAVSGDTQNADDVKKGRPPVELHRHSDAKYAAYDCDMISVGSNGSEIKTSEHSYTSSEIKEPCETHEEAEEEVEDEEVEEGEEEEIEEEAEQEEEEEEEEDEEEEDIQEVYEHGEEQGFSQLYLAVQRKDTVAVRRLLKSSVDVNVLDANKNIRSQLYATVKRLLIKNASVDPRNTFDQTSLRMASENGHLGFKHALVKSNADANIRSDSLQTPLLVSAEVNYAEIIKALIDYDGEINAVDKNGETLLHLAARNDCNAIEKVLLNESEERDARTRLKHAVSQDLPAELGLSQDSNRNKIDASQILNHIATKGGNFEVDKTPLSGKAVITGQAKRLHAHLTARHGHKEIVENLILKGANVNACNNAKMTPLHLACENGLSSIVEILLDNHATVDVMKQVKKTPFYLAAENGHADVVDVLLRRNICDFVAIYWNKTPLYVAVRNRHTKVVEVILKHSCRISGKFIKDEQNVQENAKNLVETRGNKRIKLTKPDGRRLSAGIVWMEKSTPLETMPKLDGRTALGIAVETIQPKMVKLLLSVDPCVYSDKHLGESFRFMMKRIKRPNRYKILSKMKRRKINDIMEVLCYDIQYKMECKNIKEIAHILMNSSKFNVNYQDDDLDTRLHTVIDQCEICFNHYLKGNHSRWRHWYIQTIDNLTQLLLKKGADFNMKNALGETPLKIASEKGCCHAIQILFDWEQKSGMKLDLDARDQFGATALIKAAENHHVSVMRLLLNHKVSVNLHNYYGFTALHGAVYDPNRDWFDMHLFCEGMIHNLNENLEISRWGDLIQRLNKNLQHDEKKTRFKEEMVKLLLAIDEVNVNAIDFRGNTPLDLAVKSSERITSETFKALENRGAIRNLLQLIDVSPMEVARINERGRTQLHRLIISHISHYAGEAMKAAKIKEDHEKFDLMLHGILLKPENFGQPATTTYDKGRSPLHYAVMPPSVMSPADQDLVRVLLEKGSNVNAADMYGKTPLHYAELDHQYQVLVLQGADESTKDKYGDTPRDLRQLRELVNINTYNAVHVFDNKWNVDNSLYTSGDIACVLKTHHVTELSKRKLAETVRIYSQSPRPKESSEEAIWNVWIQHKFFILNRRVSQLKPSIQRLIERLADGIKEKDWRFECQPILVGSADEGTKSVISADFDFNFKLTKFSQLCDVFPHPLGPKGYFQLRRTRDNAKRRQSEEDFDCFFNLDQCLLTNEVNSRFQIVLEDVSHDPNFWQDEHLFEWNITDRYEDEPIKPAGLCKTVRLRMIHPTEDGEGDFLFVNVSIDVVACLPVEDSWLRDQQPVAISPAVKADGCTLVFDRPRFDRSKPRGANFIFSDTFARISFAPLESRIIRESSPSIKAAYIICKLILYCNNHQNTTYQLKTSLLFCMEALKIRIGCQTKDEDKITKKELAFWVERIMFCFMEFYRLDVFPCYFMPSFRQRVVQLKRYRESEDIRKGDDLDASVECLIPFDYSPAFDIYLDLCSDDTSIDIPIVQNKYTYDITEDCLIANQDSKWEQFYRGEFISKLSSRCSIY